MSLWQKYKEQSTIKRIFILMVIVIILLMIIFGGVFFFMRPKSEQVVVPEVTPQQVPGEIINSTVNPIAVGEQINTQNRERDVRIIAEPFVERFGSYNNQDNFKNMTEIEEFMSNSLISWVNNTYKAQLFSQMPSINQYYAINTKVLSSEVTLLDEVAGEAEIVMSTQRQEVGENGVQTNLYYQDARATLELVEGSWKINGVYWQ